MSSSTQYSAPYTSIGNMLLILGRIRKGWLPNQIDSGEMERVGITPSNASRTIATLEYLGLIDENRKPTDTWKAIATSTTNDYPKVLGGVLRNAYPSIFEIHPDPANATDVELWDAFAKSEPLNQRGRMVSLFRGLCQEAGLMAGEPLTRERKSGARQSDQRTVEKTVNAEKPKPGSTPPDNTNSSLRWYNNLETLMSRLPDPNNARWSKSERTRWLSALQSVLDLLIETDEESAPQVK